MGEPCDAVGDKPDGEQDRQRPASGRDVKQEQNAGEDAQHAADEGKHRCKPGALFQPDVIDDVQNARYQRKKAIDHRRAGHGRSGPYKCKNTKQDQEDPQDVYKRQGELPGIRHDAGLLYGARRTVAFAFLTEADGGQDGRCFLRAAGGALKALL